MSEKPIMDPRMAEALRNSANFKLKSHIRIPADPDSERQCSMCQEDCQVKNIRGLCPNFKAKAGG